MKTSTLLVLSILLTFFNTNAQNIQYKYDNAGRLAVITYPNAKAINYTYDKDGNRIYQATTIDSTALPHAGIITGSLSVCVGSTIAFADTATGGAWSASNAFATVSGTGVITGISVGVDTIKYTVTNSYGTATATRIVTVNSFPSAGTITGSSSVCVGSGIILTDAVLGGTWTSSNGSATVSGGIVAGISIGSDVISYTVTNSCGTAFATKSITISPSPFAGVIVGNTSVCEGSSIILSDAVGGGTWSVSSPSATITSTGIVTGISAGTNIVIYAVANSCGTATTTYPIVILSAAACSSTGVNAISNSSNLIKVYPNPTGGLFTVEMPNAYDKTTIVIQDVYGQIIETRTIDAISGLKEIFNLQKVARGTYLIRVCSNEKTYEEKIVIW